ncbi:type II secretion system protein [Pseudoduganella violaceinigra]|uniref:type II secretion system protein n=1 Tax=Pseudoduganella violaceinigra TaxID=246602 RepID=UPI000487F8B6|nr:prepilin-type N-terminal cleavage/methylation domain-containing protein [Pseudoduganella violaceinigra]
MNGKTKGRRATGFSLLELLVAMAIMATLLSIIAPRYMGHIDRAKESVLKDDLATFRRLIDQYHSDRGAFPDSLEELVSLRYLRDIPVDPITDRRDSWLVVAPAQVAELPPGAPVSAEAPRGNVADVRSGAPGTGSDGRPYAQW